MACIQEIRWKGSGCEFYGAKGKRQKLFWMGSEERSDDVGIFVAVTRHSPRVLILKMVLDNGLLNVLTIYAPHSGKPRGGKREFFGTKCSSW